MATNHPGSCKGGVYAAKPAIAMPSQYRIVIRGPVGEHHLDHYRDEFSISSTDACTVLCGQIRDASQLHGMVSHLTKVGLELVEVRPTDN